MHEYLNTSIRGQYGYTTIGIGAATGNFDEWRTISKNEPSGGSYLRFYHEKLGWSRYAQIWNDYQDAAVYVVFYKRIPVHVTVVKNVVGSEEDKDRAFNFTATFEEHSKTIEYKEVTTYKRTRWTRWSSWEDETIDSVTTNGYKTITSESDQHTFGSGRESETFSLKDGERHPITVYFNHDEDSQNSGTTDWSGSNTSQTRTQTVTYTVVYQYETVTIQEAETNLFTLTSVSGETGHGHSGTANVAGRSYTISSKKDVTKNGFNGFATYTPLDTAIFTNTRKTGSLTVSKTVVDGEAGDTFPFIVTLGETVVDKDSYTNNYALPAGVHIGPFGKVFTFSLANGGSVTLPGLPAGASYTVEEVAHAKYVVDMPANATGTIAADSTISVGVTNTHKADLNVAMKDRTVIFTGEEQHGHEISTATGTGEEIDTKAYTVTGLKSGHVLTVLHYVLPHGTAVGSYTGHVENVRFTVLNANDNDKDVTGEYIITMTPGALTIEPTPIVVTITGNTTNVVYNGEEQSVQGYSYAITHATTHEDITNASVYVSIPPDYQMAWRKDVGRSDMPLSANHVIVTVPEGMSVSEVVVAAKGWLEVTPAPVTVKADDKVKILNRADPPLTATVTGLIGSDTIAYNPPTRAVGEAPGTYAITVTGEASQGNYAITYETGTLTIEELELIQRATGSGV